MQKSQMVFFGGQTLVVDPAFCPTSCVLPGLSRAKEWEQISEGCQPQVTHSWPISSILLSCLGSGHFIIHISVRNNWFFCIFLKQAKSTVQSRRLC